jgi:UPF0271 protein
MRIDLNADVGEGGGDLPLFPLVSSVNIACGAHAGDRHTMERCVAEAKRLKIAVGAHPGYPDRDGFGRRPLDMAVVALTASLVEQIEALASIAHESGTTMTHVKPHGALYNQAAVDPRLADAIVRAVFEVDPAMRIVGLAGSALLTSAQEAGLPWAAEAFADRRYLGARTLVPRGTPGALIEDPDAAAKQAVAIAAAEAIETLDGSSIVVTADTICLHADTPGALAIATAVRSALEAAGMEVAPLPPG